METSNMSALITQNIPVKCVLLFVQSQDLEELGQSVHYFQNLFGPWKQLVQTKNWKNLGKNLLGLQYKVASYGAENKDFDNALDENFPNDENTTDWVCASFNAWILDRSVIVIGINFALVKYTIHLLL